ncbi:MAG: hypothetical protein J7639_31885 [Paenibacillaceae bacterium]|nr:hypothetical protein [Paenibacillaceae bacterium]
MNLMLFGLQAGVARELTDNADSVVPKTVVERLKYKLNQEYGIEEELAHWVVQEWAGVLDKQGDTPPPVPAMPAMPPPVPQTVLPPRIAKPRRYFAVISSISMPRTKFPMKNRKIGSKAKKEIRSFRDIMSFISNLRMGVWAPIPCRKI